MNYPTFTATLDGGTHAVLVEQVPCKSGSLYQEVIELPGSDHDRLNAAVVSPSRAIGDFETVSKAAARYATIALLTALGCYASAEYAYQQCMSNCTP